MKHSAFTRSLALLCVGALPAQTQQPTVRDSSGVEIVEYRTLADAPVTFRIAPSARLDVGGVQSRVEDEFNSRNGYLTAVRLRDGGVAVLDGTRLLFFGRTGTKVGSIGRQGRGPGEFTTLTAMCATRGDTIVVGDAGTRRFSVIDEHRQLVRTIPQGELGAMFADSCFSDGSFVTSSTRFAPGERPSASLVLSRIGLEGQVKNALGNFISGTGDPLTRRRTLVATLGSEVIVGLAERYELRAYSTEGRLVRVVRTADAPRAITEAEATAAIASAIPNGLTAGERDERVARVRRLRTDVSWPAYDRVLSSSNGGFWVRSHRLSSSTDPERWTHFNAVGRLVGQLVLRPQNAPGRFTILGFYENEVLILRDDDDGAPHLMLFPLEKLATAAPKL